MRAGSGTLCHRYDFDGIPGRVRHDERGSVGVNAVARSPPPSRSSAQPSKNGHKPAQRKRISCAGTDDYRIPSRRVFGMPNTRAMSPRVERFGRQDDPAQLDGIVPIPSRCAMSCPLRADIRIRFSLVVTTPAEHLAAGLFRVSRGPSSRYCWLSDPDHRRHGPLRPAWPCRCRDTCK